jgi:hypothetical protein
MKRVFRKSGARFCGHAMIVLAGIALLFPGSASVLCIAPGGHVAVEDINAACCARSAIGIRAGNQPGNGVATAGGCQNCTDVFIAQSARGTITESRDTVTSNSLADACLQGNLPADTRHSSRRSAPVTGTGSPAAAASSVPLRC